MARLGRGRLGGCEIVGLVAVASASACGPAPSPASAVASAPEFSPEGQTKCSVQKSQARPLIVEWPSADRAALEAQARRGLVAVRYSGCEMEVLRQCRGPGSYLYTPTTQKHDRVSIRDADELYAQVPLGAAKLEGTLAKSGELNVLMTIVGTYEADRAALRADELEGNCEGATHIVSGLTAGAFEFFAGSAGDVGAEASLLGAGAGAKSSSRRELLNQDGSPASCASAKGDDKAPPYGCGALLRLEVVPLGAAKHAECPPGTRAEGGGCVAAVNTDCPAGTRFEAGRGCVAIVTTPTPGPAPAAAPPPAPPAPAASAPPPPAPAPAAPAPAPATDTRFSVAGGTVRDNRTGLTWQQDPGAPQSWSAARAYCKSLGLAGGGFRLPSREELGSLLNPYSSPRIDTRAFPASANGSYWTSTPFSGLAGSVAWSINFGSGESVHVPTSQSLLVRCVR